MSIKAELDQAIQKAKKLEERTEAAEAKVKQLEEEKIKGGNSMVFGNRSTSDESRAMKYFGVSHPSQLLSVNVGDQRYARVPDELKHLVLQFKKAVDVSRWTSQMFHGQDLDKSGRNENTEFTARVKGMMDHNYGRNVLAPMVKAFGSTVTGAGDEWVPTAMSSSYISEYELEKVIESRLETINMPSNPFEIPAIKKGTKARKATEGGTLTAANFETKKLTLSAVKTQEYYELPEELTEDSAADFLAAARAEVIKAQINAIESAIINGDSDGTHIDSDTQAAGADVAEKIWNGWRKLALANAGNGSTLDFSNAAVSATLLQQLRARMGKLGVNPRELAWICGPSVLTQFLSLDSVATIDKFGPQATVLNGALAAYQGIPIITSEHMREDLNATGVFDGTTTTQGGLLLVNLTRWMLGQRRPIKTILVNSLPSQDQYLLASYRRSAFVGHDQDAIEKSVVYGYNIAK